MLGIPLSSVSKWSASLDAGAESEQTGDSLCERIFCVHRWSAILVGLIITHPKLNE